jgi:hypothetical protein
MNAQHGHGERASAPLGLHTSNKARRPRPPGRDRGLALLYWFVVASAIMVGAIVVAASVGHWWILIPGMAVHFLMTFLVLSAIFRLMTEGNDE